jgi:glutathione synthase/RimK-type ligase-like ATP-grasp enzyme
VGEEVFAVEIESDRDDYRYAARDGGRIRMSDVVLEAGLVERLRKLARSMDLIVAGIDLRRTPTGEVYCLEVNPSPAFTFYEGTHGRLAERVASVLRFGNALHLAAS